MKRWGTDSLRLFTMKLRSTRRKKEPQRITKSTKKTHRKKLRFHEIQLVSGLQE